MHQPAADEDGHRGGAGAEVDHGRAEIGLVVGQHGEAGHIGARHHGLDGEMAALDCKHQIARRRDICRRHVHIDAEAAAQHAARIADAVGAVDRVADRQRVQHRAAVAQRMPAAGREHARDVAFRDGRAGDVDIGGKQLAGKTPGRDRQHHGFDFDRGHLFGRIHRQTDGFFGLGKIDHTAALHAASLGVTEADDFDRMSPAGQDLLRRMWPQPGDEAGDFARAHVKRRDQCAASRRNRLHLRREAIVEGAHASPPFFFFLAASFSAAARACAAESDNRTVTRSGKRRSTIVISRDNNFLSRSNVTR